MLHGRPRSEFMCNFLVRFLAKAQFPLAELTGCVDGPSTRVVENGLNLTYIK